MKFMDGTMLHIGNVPQFFFDNVLIEQVQDIFRTVHRPKKHPHPILRRDKPWESNPYFTVNGWSVVRDSKTQEFRCWYDDWIPNTSEVKRLGYLYCIPGRTSLASSVDGRTWTKPQLDYLVENGRHTNVVVGNLDVMKLESTCVFEDPLEKDPQRRYKMFLDRYVIGRNAPQQQVLSQKLTEEIKRTRDGRDGLTDLVRVELHHSPDGLHWTAHDDLPRFGQHGNGLGDCYTIFPDQDSGVYRLLTRSAGMETVHYDARRPRTGSFFPPHFPHDEPRENRRRVFQSESSDLVHWTRPQCILTPDPLLDNLDDSYYGMTQFRLGELFLGFVHVLHEVSNTLDVRMAYSRDSWKWQFVDRQPWLGVSPDSWDCCMVNMSAPPIQVGDELYIYYGGARHHHDWWIVGEKEGLNVPEATSMEHVEYSLGLSTLRLNGFVSLDAGPVREGILITRVLQTESRNLSVNALCGVGGYIRVEATDADDQVLPGFSRDSFDVFQGDSTSQRLSWQGRTAIPHQGALRLRFFMRNASLYSLSFA
jgi:hypothetical protein